MVEYYQLYTYIPCQHKHSILNAKTVLILYKLSYIQQQLLLLYSKFNSESRVNKATKSPGPLIICMKRAGLLNYIATDQEVIATQYTLYSVVQQEILFVIYACVYMPSNTLKMSMLLYAQTFSNSNNTCINNTCIHHDHDYQNCVDYC